MSARLQASDPMFSANRMFSCLYGLYRIKLHANNIAEWYRATPARALKQPGRWNQTMYEMIELTDAELDAVAAGQGNNPSFNIGDQTDNVVGVIAVVNVGDISVLSNSTIGTPQLDGRRGITEPPQPEFD